MCVPTDDHVSQTPWLEEIEAQWGPAPGKLLSNGSGIHVLGIQLGNITVALQPGFGHEGDPMRLLFEGGFAPTHAFSCFYRYLQESIGVDALLHFGTHGALEFMPGKQTGLSGQCWPDRLIGDTPNFYFYAANNPSEATIAKRRSAATLISYLTPSISEAGLYKGLADIKTAIVQWNQLEQHGTQESKELFAMIRQQAKELEFGEELDWSEQALDATMNQLSRILVEYENELIPCGLHVIGETPSLEERVDVLHAYTIANEIDFKADDLEPEPERPSKQAVIELLEADALSSQSSETVSNGEKSDKQSGWQRRLLEMNAELMADSELSGMLKALDGGYTAPAPGGDLLKNPETLPTGRNVHGFDPFRLPSLSAQKAGAYQAELLLQRHVTDNGCLPRSIAFVLWGSDNLKNEGVPIAQVMALMGARPRVDAYGKLSGAELIPLEELGRPRIDVLTTLSGVFRDLLPLQTRMLAEAALLASSADEPEELNFVRKHTLAHQARNNCDFETAALRVFSNADGAYGANVNLLIDSGAWEEESELADTYANRKCYAFGIDGEAVRQPKMLETALADVDLAYQNVESVELGVTQLDYYFDTLGGINSMVKQSRPEPAC